MNVCVVALGKIGLPLSAQIASKGHRVTGLDIDQGVVALANHGQAPFDEPGLEDRLTRAIGDGLFSATTDSQAAVSEADAVILVVPLVVGADDQPDFTAMDAATDSIGPYLKPGVLVSYETTLPVYTTSRRFAPRLAELSGLSVGTDLFVCHSPERVSSGTVFRDLRRYPKLVGGVDEPSAEVAVEFYKSVLEFDDRPDLDRENGVWDLGSAEAAELAKLAETTYRDVNIALANEFARFSDRAGIDVQQVIDASNSQPFSHIHTPGIAVGGHCIPVYPRLYLSVDPDATVPRVCRAANAAMPGYALDRLESIAGPVTGRTVGIWGVAYRGGVKEPAFSGAFPLKDLLVDRGARVVAADPLFSAHELEGMGFEVWDGKSEIDLLVIQANHPEYRDLLPGDIPGVQAVLDGRRVLDAGRWEDAGVPVRSIGDGR
jgi:nucleotide sugar dehydrogenase